MTRHPPRRVPSKAEERFLRASGIALRVVVAAALGGIIGLVLVTPDPLRLARFFEEPEAQREEAPGFTPSPAPPIVYLRMIYPTIGTTLGAIVGAAYGGYVAKRIDERRRQHSDSDS